MRSCLLVLAVCLAGCLPFGDRMTRRLDATGVVDLTHALSAKTPHWPGKAYRPFSVRTIATLEKDGVYSKTYCTPEHLGTHVDAANHFERDQPPLDRIALRNLYGPVFVIDIRRRVAKDPSAMLTRRDVALFERKISRKIPPRALVFLRTGWAKRVGNVAAYQNKDQKGQMRFPGFSPGAARMLITERKVSALGIDTLSIDRGLSKKFQVHHIVGAAGAYGLENLANLDLLPEAGAFAVVAPIKIKGGSGGQVRVLAFIPK